MHIIVNTINVLKSKPMPYTTMYTIVSGQL